MKKRKILLSVLIFVCAIGLINPCFARHHDRSHINIMYNSSPYGMYRGNMMPPPPPAPAVLRNAVIYDSYCMRPCGYQMGYPGYYPGGGVNFGFNISI